MQESKLKATDGTPATSRALAKFVFAVSVGLLAVYFFVPVRAVLDPSLDLSNFASYVRFTAEGRRFGSEVAPMAGPFGFIVYGWVYGGDLYFLRQALELLVKAVFAALLLWPIARQPRSAWNLLWFVSALLILSISPELIYDFCVLFSAFYLLLARPRQIIALFVVGFLALLALAKGTQLIFTSAVLVLVAIDALLGRRWRDLFTLIVGFATAVAGLWLLTGQSLADFPRYLRYMQELSGGYASGMALQESPRTFALGVGTAFAVAASLIVTAWYQRRDRSVLIVTAILAAFMFLEWKHGFVRADGHVLLFFHYGMLAAILPVDTFFGHSLGGARIRGVFRGLALTLGFLGAHPVIGSSLVPYLTEPVERLKKTYQQLVHIRATENAFAHQLAQQEKRFALPQVRKQVGDDTITFFGYESGFLRLNRLHEQPSPVAGGGPFSVFTQNLQLLNERFVTNDRTAPQYYLVKLQTIDQHLMTQDDSRSLDAILHLYRPVLAERGMLLLRRDERPSPRPKLEVVKTVTFKPGERVPVPTATGQEVILLSLDLPWSLPGALRTAAYKGAVVTLDLALKGQGEPETRRIIPSMTSAPFIVSPFIDSTSDLLQLYSANQGKEVEAFSVNGAPSYSLSKVCTATFYRSLRPPALESTEFAQLAAQLGYEFANRVPTIVQSPNSRRGFADGGTVQVLEPPGTIEFKLNGDERSVDFAYGIEPEAYERGKTDGADFIVDLTFPNAGPERIYTTRLEPRSQPGDRGRHYAHVWLPILQSGTTLQLRSGPGKTGAADWDWTYFDSIQLNSGLLQVEQFPGFGISPLRVEAGAPRMITEGGHPVLLLGTPSSVEFSLAPSYRKIHFTAGLVRGAYEQGNTDGIDIVVEIQNPAKQAPTTLLRRRLQPKTVSTDRGDIEIELSLPPTEPGSRLIIRMLPGPVADVSWDWSYLGNVRMD